MYELTGSNLDWILIVAGLAVWARVAAYYVCRRPYLRIAPPPDADAVRFGPNAILIVLLVFLLTGQLAQEMALLFRPDLSDFARQIIADSAAKIAAGGVMVFVFVRFLHFGQFMRAATGDQAGAPLSRWRGLRTVFRSALIYAAAYPVVNVLVLSAGIILFEKLLDRVPESHQAFEILNEPTTGLALRVQTLLLAAVISPIVEEFFFRGLVQNTLYKFFRRPWPAILSAAALFALVHVPLYQQIPALWVLGVILGWSYYRYRSLAVPVVTHIIFNGVTLVFWYLGGPD